MSKETEYGANMLIYTTFWGNDKTFKLLPINKECPYTEVIYDTQTELLVVISKNKKQNYEMLPKLDDDGNMIQSKKPKTNGKPMKEERRLMEVPQEHYIIERAEQESFIDKWGLNSDDFDFKKYLDAKPAGSSEIITEQKESALVGTDGKALTVAK
jgi:hypothetical protein